MELLTDCESLSKGDKMQEHCQWVSAVATFKFYLSAEQKENWPEAEKLRYFCFPLVES